MHTYTESEDSVVNPLLPCDEKISQKNSGKSQAETAVPATGDIGQKNGKGVQGKPPVVPLAAAPPEPKPKPARPRDLIWDALKEHIFSGVNGADKVIPRVKKALVEAYPDVTPEQIESFAKWWRRSHDADVSVPRGSNTLPINYGLWLQKQSKYTDVLKLATGPYTAPNRYRDRDLKNLRGE